MSEEIKNRCESPQDNQSETEDNRLPYESPKLRKHGKVNETTGTIIPGVPFDLPGFPRADIS
jgi:hypothetical protein